MPYRPTAKTEQKKEVMRQRLLDAARNLFARQGYAATTLQQIVTEAQTSVGNCYFYFPNKEALLFAIAEELRGELARRVDAAIAPLPPGPELLAAAIFEGTLAMLDRAKIARFALFDSAHPTLRLLTLELFASRARRVFEAMPAPFSEWPDAATPQLAAAAWQGAVYYVLEETVAGRIKEDPRQIARFLAGWNLRALGFSNEAIQQAVKRLV